MQIKLPQIGSKDSLSVIYSLRPEQKFERFLLSGQDKSGAVLRNLRLEEAVVEKSIFTGANLEKLDLLDVELRGCDFSAAQCGEGSLFRTRFVSGRMAGVDFSQTTLKGVIFESCKLDMANFRFAKLHAVRFVNCELREADFQGATLSHVQFEDCFIEKAEFAQCTMKNCDAKGSQLIDLKGWQHLKGLTIDTAQLVMVAPQLALALGLTVE